MNKREQSSFPLGFCWSFRGCPPESGLPQLRDSGFEGIELWPNFLNKWGTSRWKAALDANAMRCFQLCPYFDFVHGDTKIAESWQTLHTFLAAAQVLECRRLRVFTGPPWGEDVVGAREATKSQWEAAIRSLCYFCDFAPEIEFCLECHAGSLMEDAASTLRLIEGVHLPNLRVNLQLPLREENWHTSLEALAPWTTHIHIHNWEQGLGEGALTFLAEGTFDWTPVLAHLSAQGREVCLSIEHAEHGGRHDAWETARRDGPFLQTLRRNVVRPNQPFFNRSNAPVSKATSL